MRMTHFAHDSTETFGFLASPSARSYNTGYTDHYVRPNSAKGGTSYSPKPLYVIGVPSVRIERISVNSN